MSDAPVASHHDLAEPSMANNLDFLEITVTN
jgi:hypothetical protein